MKIKTILIGLSVLVLLSFALSMDALAQGRGKGPPPWAPAHGYRAKTRQVYFPDQNFYFDVQKGVYIYLSGGKWEVGVKLPSFYAGIDLKQAVQIELELDTDTPQLYNSEHLVKYKAKPHGEKIKMQNEPHKGNSGNPGKGKNKK